MFYKAEPNDLFPREDWITIKVSGIGLDIIDAYRGGTGQNGTAPTGAGASGGTNSTGTAGIGKIGSTNSKETDPRDGNPLFVKFSIQNGQLRSKPIVLYLRKTDTFKDLTTNYIEAAGLIGKIIETQVKFIFDGEVLKSTPSALDMEEEECIDVLVQ